MKPITTPKYAEWRVRQEDSPRIRATARHVLRTIQWHQWLLGLTGIAVTMGSFWLDRVVDSLGAGLGYFLVSCAASLGNRRADDPLLALAPQPLPKDHFPAEVVIRSGNLLVGRDQGIVALIDGWMHFDGESCEFSLLLSDVRRWKDPRSARDFPSLEIDDFKVSVHPFQAMRDAEGRLITLGEEPALAWQSWLQGASPKSGQSLLPPRRVHPWMARQIAINGALTSAVLTLLGIVMLAIIGLRSEGVLIRHPFLFAGILLFGILVFGSIRGINLVALHQYDRRVRRLEQAEALTLEPAAQATVLSGR